jgi:hypothetical protein
MASRVGFFVIEGGLLVVVLRLIGREEASLWSARRVASGDRRGAHDVGVRTRAGAFAVTLDTRLLYGLLILVFIGYLPGLGSPGRGQRS